MALSLCLDLTKSYKLGNWLITYMENAWIVVLLEANIVIDMLLGIAHCLKKKGCLFYLQHIYKQYLYLLGHKSRKAKYFIYIIHQM